MARLPSTVKVILDRVRKVTENTAATLRRQLTSIDDEKRKLTAHLDDAAERIKKTLSELGHTNNGKRVFPQPRRKSGKRIRRNSDQLKHDAEAIIQFIKSKGSDGAKGGDIRQHHPKVGPDIKGFVHKHSGR